VNLLAALLAEQAQVRDSLLFVLGGACEFWTVPEFPCRIVGTVVLVFETGPDELGDHEGQVQVLDGGRVAGKTDFAVRTVERTVYVEGAPWIVNAVVPVAFEVRRHGPHMMRVLYGNDQTHEFRFGVRLAGGGDL
jgi:hypothetical protein